MPAKKRKNLISDAERARRLEAAGRQIGTSDAPHAFKQAFNRVVRPKTAAQNEDSQGSRSKASKSR